MNVMTLLEIAGNPLDLYISFGSGQVKDRPGWGFLFMRGPGHNYKPLFDGLLSQERFPDIQDALRWIRNTLYNAVLATVAHDTPFQINVAISDLIKAALPESLSPEQVEKTARALLGEDWARREGCLSLEQIDRIMEELTTDQQCDTSHWE